MVWSLFREGSVGLELFLPWGELIFREDDTPLHPMLITVLSTTSVQSIVSVEFPVGSMKI